MPRIFVLTVRIIDKKLLSIIKLFINCKNCRDKPWCKSCDECQDKIYEQIVCFDVIKEIDIRDHVSKHYNKHELYTNCKKR